MARRKAKRYKHKCPFLSTAVRDGELVLRIRQATGHWVVGSYIHDKRYPTIRVFGGGEPFVVPETLGQFIFRTDKNGKDIFEGDIVTVNGRYPRPCG